MPSTMQPPIEASFESSQPILPEVGVLALVPDSWSLIWQLRHQILTRLARYFHVVWVDPPLAWRAMLDGTTRRPPARSPDVPGFRVHTAEKWLPTFYRPSWLTTLTSRLRLARARNVLTRAGCEVILLSLWRPDFADALRHQPSSRRCYHIDDEYSFSDVEAPLSDAERTLIAQADLVFVSSPALHVTKGKINRHTAFVPNGVDYPAYASTYAEPEDLATIPRPRIGYCGTLKRQLDWSLLSRLIDLRPNWSFVFVGPTQEHQETQRAIKRLAARPNVYFLGGKPAYALPPYPQHFDVCVMPYCINEYTRYIYPLKLHEYLASGRPTVGSTISSLGSFTDVVTLAYDADDWLAALDEALTPAANSPERCAARRAVARTHDWEGLVQRMARLMAERLGPAYVRRLEMALDVGGNGAKVVPSAVPGRSV